jgi:hypothetical protein
MSNQDKIGIGVLVSLFAALLVLLVLTFRSPGGEGKAGTPSDNAIVRHSVEKRQ